MNSVHRLSMRQLQGLIRLRTQDAGNVFVTTHARQRMRQRHVSLALLLDVLRLGAIRQTPEPDPARGSIVCRMEYFVAGRHLAVAAALSDDNPGVVVVTVFEQD